MLTKVSRRSDGGRRQARDDEAMVALFGIIGKVLRASVSRFVSTAGGGLKRQGSQRVVVVRRRLLVRAIELGQASTMARQCGGEKRGKALHWGG